MPVCYELFMPHEYMRQTSSSFCHLFWETHRSSYPCAVNRALPAYLTARAAEGHRMRWATKPKARMTQARRRFSASCRSTEPNTYFLLVAPTLAASECPLLRHNSGGQICDPPIPSNQAGSLPKAWLDATNLGLPGPEHCQSHPSAMYKGCTRAAHRIYKGQSLVHPLYFRCTSGVRLLYA
jgi:hypothetical protein